MPRVLQQRLLFAVGAIALAATMFAAYAREVFVDSAEFADRVAVAVESTCRRPSVVPTPWRGRAGRATAANEPEAMFDGPAQA